MNLVEQVARMLCASDPDAIVGIWVPERMNERTKPKRYCGALQPTKTIRAWEANIYKAEQIIALIKEKQ